jgi:TonB family protein
MRSSLLLPAFALLLSCATPQFAQTQSSDTNSQSTVKNEKSSGAAASFQRPPSCPKMPTPHYTKEARAAKFGKSVLVEGVINVDGTVSNVRILKSPGLGLDEAVLKTLKKWKCTPAIGVNGKPVPAIVPLEFHFSLD